MTELSRYLKEADAAVYDWHYADGRMHGRVLIRPTISHLRGVKFNTARIASFFPDNVYLKMQFDTYRSATFDNGTLYCVARHIESYSLPALERSIRRVLVSGMRALWINDSSVETEAVLNSENGLLASAALCYPFIPASSLRYAHRAIAILLDKTPLVRKA